MTFPWFLGFRKEGPVGKVEPLAKEILVGHLENSLYTWGLGRSWGSWGDRPPFPH